MLAADAAERAPEIVDRIRRMMAATPVAGIIGALSAMRDRHDSTGLLPTLAGLPTLVIVGEEDAMTPPEGARRMAAALPGARLVAIAGAGHLPPVERPSETTAAILDFLRVVG
jgi:pimeloyl-ACP methyl ester carboxylesterase